MVVTRQHSYAEASLAEQRRNARVSLASVAVVKSLLSDPPTAIQLGRAADPTVRDRVLFVTAGPFISLVNVVEVRACVRACMRLPFVCMCVCVCVRGVNKEGDFA